MLYVLIGEDEFSRRQAFEAIRRGLGDPAGLATNTTTLDGEKVSIEQLHASCETMPFLADHRLVIIERLLERFEARGKAGKKARPAEKKEEVAALAACMTHIPDFTALVVLGGDIKRRNPLLTALSGKAEIREFPMLKGRDLNNWVERRVTEVGAAISPGAVQLLTRYIGGNLRVMASEIDKLVLFTGGRRIEEKDALTLVSSVQEANIFAMVDAILEERIETAGPLLQKLLTWGATPSHLLNMLARQANLIVRAKELTRQKKPRAEIQAALGLNDYPMQQVLKQAGQHSLERIKEVYHQLLDADMSIKTGRFDGDLALDILVAELCQAKRV